jgi:hypothetical protein
MELYIINGKKLALHQIEKQLILYTKCHFKRVDYKNDLKYFAAELYGLSPEQVELCSISHMVVDLYQKLADNGLITFNLKNFLSDTFRRAFREENKREINWNILNREMLAEIQGMQVQDTILEGQLGKADLSLLPEFVE